MDPRELRLDGNAAAGVLTEIFGMEMTVNRTVCANCGAENLVGDLMAYVHGMGSILRCPHCDTALIRIVHARGRYLLDLRGIRTLELTDALQRTP